MEGTPGKNDRFFSSSNTFYCVSHLDYVTMHPLLYSSLLNVLITKFYWKLPIDGDRRRCVVLGSRDLWLDAHLDREDEKCRLPDNSNSICPLNLGKQCKTHNPFFSQFSILLVGWPAILQFTVGIFLHSFASIHSNHSFSTKITRRRIWWIFTSFLKEKPTRELWRPLNS